MSHRGRPRALADEQKRRTLLAMISVGAGLDAAARHVGCSTWTIRREAQRDEHFADRLREAETAAALMPLQMLRNAANTQWRAAAWLLERLNPDQFTRRKPETVSPNQVGTLLNEVATLLGELCQDDAEQELLSEQLENLRQRYLAEPQSAPQGPTPPKSELQSFLEQFDREHDASMTAFQTGNRPRESNPNPPLFARNP